MPDKWQVVKVEGSWGTEYYIQHRITRRMLAIGDGIYRTTNRDLAELFCKEANEKEKQNEQCRS